MKRFGIVILVVIVFLAVISYFFLNISNTEWKIKVLNLPNIVKRNPVIMQEGIKAPVMLSEFEIRIAAFQIRKKGSLIPDYVARLWQKKGLLKGFSQGFEGKDLYFQFNEKRVEIWTCADKFFVVKDGKVIIKLLDNNGQLIASATEEVNIFHQPPKIDEI